MAPTLPDHPAGPISTGEVYRTVVRIEQALEGFMAEMRDTRMKVALHEQTLATHAHDLRNLKQAAAAKDEVAAARMESIQIPVNVKTMTVLFLVLGSLIVSLVLAARADVPLPVPAQLQERP
jgi:hypothetical protein